MPEAKLILITESSGDRYTYNRSEVVGSITDWEEVTEEELGWLTTYIKYLPTPGYGLQYVLLVKDQTPLRYRVDSLRELILEEKVKQEAEQTKKDEVNRRRAETKRKNKEEKERKMLEELKAKYGS